MGFGVLVFFLGSGLRLLFFVKGWGLFMVSGVLGVLGFRIEGVLRLRVQGSGLMVQDLSSTVLRRLGSWPKIRLYRTRERAPEFPKRRANPGHLQLEGAVFQS